MTATRLSPTSTTLTVGTCSVRVAPPVAATRPARRRPHRVTRPVTPRRGRRTGLALGSLAAVVAAAVLSPSGTGVAPVFASATSSAAASHAVTDSWSGSSRRIVVTGL